MSKWAHLVVTPQQFSFKVSMSCWCSSNEVAATTGLFFNPSSQEISSVIGAAPRAEYTTPVANCPYSGDAGVLSMLFDLLVCKDSQPLSLISSHCILFAH